MILLQTVNRTELGLDIQADVAERYSDGAELAGKGSQRIFFYSDTVLACLADLPLATHVVQLNENFPSGLDNKNPTGELLFLLILEVGGDPNLAALLQPHHFHEKRKNV